MGQTLYWMILIVKAFECNFYFFTGNKNEYNEELQFQLNSMQALIAKENETSLFVLSCICKPLNKPASKCRQSYQLAVSLSSWSLLIYCRRRGVAAKLAGYST